MHSVDTSVSAAYSSIMWFNDATTVDVFRVITSLLSIVRPNAPLKQQDQEMVTEFHKWLRGQQRWLLIFDNVENFDAIRDILPPPGDTGHIIFATRHRVLASYLTSGPEPIEILPMDYHTATTMAQSLAEESSLAVDKTPEVANRVAQFAKGLPLVIEQVIHNALLFPRSIEETLRLVEHKADLLEQENVSSLRGPDSSISAIVMQSMADLKSRDAEAEALFKLMVCWSSSSIPLNMIRNGAGRLHSYLDRSFTFDRGATMRTRDRDVDRIDLPTKSPKFRLFDEEPFSRDTWLRFLRLKQHKSMYTNTDLPLDETKFDAALRAACSEEFPIGRLFKNEDSILHAIKVVTGTGLVRKSGIDTVWIHDLFSEVANAIIERNDRKDNSALVAATLVYLAFPVPTRQPLRDRYLLCAQYLPHALTCHHHLKTQGILNDLSLGPELSHTIASAFCMGLQPPHTNSSTNSAEGLSESLHTMEQRRNSEAIRFYKDALTGYIASQKRVDSMPGVTPLRIVLSAVADEARERRRGYHYDHYTMDTQRFGRNAHWRIVQTALRLSRRLQQGSYDQLEEAVDMNTIALQLHEKIFGTDHDDTIRIRLELHHQLFKLERFEEAYDVSLLGLKHLLGWSQKKQVYCGGKDEHKSFITSGSAAGFCHQVGMCCLELPAKAREAVIYFKITLKHSELMCGEGHYTSVRPMQRLAMAFEKCDEKVGSICWYGCSVLCALNVLEVERLTYLEHEEGYIMWSSSLLRSETFMQETVERYEEARDRFGAFEGLSIHRFLSQVEHRITLWRLDRDNFGSPYDDARSMDQKPRPTVNESTEEYEARAQKEIEEWTASQRLEGNVVPETQDDRDQ